jgi:hypothetical protein
VVSATNGFQGGNGSVLPNAVFNYVLAVPNSTLQGNLWNSSATPCASTDWIVTSDDGSNSTHYGDFGINSSVYNCAGWTAGGAHATYLLGTDDLLADAIGGTFSIYTGGTLAANLRMQVSNGGSIGVPSTGSVDYHAAAHTAPAIVVANVGALPASGCIPGELAIVSAATAGQQIYENSGTGSCTWTQQSGGGGGTPGGSSGQMQVNSSGSFGGQGSVFDAGTKVQRAVECTKGTTAYTALTAAASSQEITILGGTTPLSGNLRYEGMLMSETTQFASTTGLTVSMGRPGSTTHAEMSNGSTMPLQVSAGDGNYVSARPLPPAINTTYSIVLNFSVTSGNVNAATAGALTWEVCAYAAR